jgi:hypothetical protein
VIAGAAFATGDLPGYLADLRTAVAVLPRASRTNQAFNQLGYTMPGMLLVYAASRLASAGTARPLGSFGRGGWAGLLTVVAALAIEVQNHPEPENPLLPIALLLGWTVSRRDAEDPPRFSDRIGTVIGCSVLVIMLALDISAVGWTAIAPVDSGRATAWLTNTRVTDLRIASHYTGPEPLVRNLPQVDSEVLARWDEAITLLRPHLNGRQDVTVLPFMWSNPFPVLLGLPPVRHELAWWECQPHVQCCPQAGGGNHFQQCRLRAGAPRLRQSRHPSGHAGCLSVRPAWPLFLGRSYCPLGLVGQKGLRAAIALLIMVNIDLTAQVCPLFSNF